MNDDFAATTRVHKSPAEVLAALTNLNALGAWWAPVTGSGAVGGELAFTFSDNAPTVLRVDEASGGLVRWTCLRSGDMPDWAGTEMTFVISPGAGGTVIFFHHHGLTADLECFEDCYAGWSHFISSLTKYIETGIGMPFESQELIVARADQERARLLAS
jgi:uncharacterized protein YndB with AHSA1/START domain